MVIQIYRYIECIKHHTDCIQYSFTIPRTFPLEAFFNSLSFPLKAFCNSLSFPLQASFNSLPLLSPSLLPLSRQESAYPPLVINVSVAAGGRLPTAERSALTCCTRAYLLVPECAKVPSKPVSTSGVNSLPVSAAFLTER